MAPQNEKSLGIRANIQIAIHGEELSPGLPVVKRRGRGSGGSFFLSFFTVYGWTEWWVLEVLK